MASLSKPPAAASTSTLKTLPTSQLRPGMFLVRILDSWWKSPFFVHRRLLKSPTDVQQLMSSGIREVEIDTSLGVEVSSEAESEFDEDAFISEETDMPLVSCGHDESVPNDRGPGSLGTETPSSLATSRPQTAPARSQSECERAGCETVSQRLCGVLVRRPAFREIGLELRLVGRRQRAQRQAHAVAAEEAASIKNAAHPSARGVECIDYRYQAATDRMQLADPNSLGCTSGHPGSFCH